MPLGTKLVDCAELPQALKVSPDGKRLAYLARSGITSGWDVQLVEASGERRLLSGGWPFIQSGGLAFSPDGREVWFAGDRDGSTSALHAVTLDGRVRLVAQLPTDLVLHDIWKDGRVLLARETRRSSVAVRVDGDPADRDLSWLDFSGFGGFTPDGKSVAIVEFGQGGGPSYTTYLRKLDGSPAVRMTEGGAVISPDGAFLLTMTRNRSRIQVVPVGAGQPRELPGAFETVNWMAWFPDGKRVVFHGRETGHARRVWVQETAAGPPRPITPEGWSLAFSSRPVSPDGRSVVVVDPDQLPMLVPGEGGPPRPIPGVVAGDVPVQWSQDGRFLYVDAETLRIFKVDVADGKRVLWRRIETPPDASNVSSGFGIAPDERSYGYTYQRVLSDLYLVDGLK